MGFRRRQNVLIGLNIGNIIDYNNLIKKIDFIYIRPKDRYNEKNITYFRLIKFQDTDFNFEPGKLITTLFDIAADYYKDFNLPIFIELKKGTEYNSCDALFLSEVKFLFDYEKFEWENPQEISPHITILSKKDVK